MPRMPGRPRTLLALVAAALAYPASASAATLTVDPAAAPGCAAGVCKTIGAANAAAADGDTISIKASKTPYVEAPIVVTKRNLVFEAQPGGAIVTSTGAAGSLVFRLGDGTGTTGEGAVLRNLVVSAQENGGSAVRVSAKGVTIESSFVARSAATTQDAAALLVDDAVTGTTTVRSSFVVNAPAGAAGQSAPALQGGAASSLALLDTVVVAGPANGPGLALAGNDRTENDDTKPVANRVVRSTVLAGQVDAAAIALTSASGSSVDKALTVDSSILSGGQNGTGLAVASQEDGLPLLSTSTSGDLAVSLVHTTIAGNAKAITATAAADGPALPAAAPAGSIAVTVSRSILEGTVTGANTDSVPLATAGNTVTIGVTGSDATVTPSDSSGTTITASGNQDSPAAALFADAANENFRLRVGSPAIDQAGAQLAGASETDVDGEPRVTGAAADLGADEFLNKLPVPAIATAKDTYAVNEVVTFDGSKSIDPEQAAGGGIARYVWSFGDGSAAVETATPSVQHAYKAPGRYTARLGIADAQGGVSATVASVTITVTEAGAAPDGTAPKVVVLSPKRGGVVRLYTVRTRTVKRKDGTTVRRRVRTRRTVRFSGTVSDASGVAGVQVALRRVRLAKTRTTTPRARAAQSARCTFLDLRTSAFKVLPCAKPRFANVAVKDGIWGYKLKAAAFPRLRAGDYELIVKATDRTGTTSTPVRVAFRIRIS